MSYYGLMEPKSFGKDCDVEEEIKKANRCFFSDFIDSQDRKYIYEDPIVVKKYYKSGMYERFLHSVSMRDKEFYNMYPCNNDEQYINCPTFCKVYKSPKVLQELNRALCLYRLARIYWLPQIIDLANKNDPNIRIWRKEEQDRTNKKWRWKRYVRYENGLADYILIFNEIYEDKVFKYLDFRTAYPVFMKRDKFKFSKDFRRYKEGLEELTTKK